MASGVINIITGASRLGTRPLESSRNASLRLVADAQERSDYTVGGGCRVILREFRDADLAGIRALIQRTIDDCCPSAYPPRAVDLFKSFHSDDAILGCSKDGHAVVIEDDREIVGTGAVADGKVTGVFVAPERQGAGLGGMIMDDLEAHAYRSGYASVNLSVSLPSRGFYEHRGYRIGEGRSLDMGDGQRLDYWEAVKGLGRESE